MFLTVNELTGLPGLPGTLPGIRMAMNKRAAGSPDLVRKRAGTKAFEYHADCLPEMAREIVMQRHINQVLEQQTGTQVVVVERKRDVAKLNIELELIRKCPALLERKLSTLTDKQKKTAEARIVLVQEVIKLMNPQIEGMKGFTRKDAVELIATRSREGTLSDMAQQAAEVANARKGANRKGISVRSLQQWVSDYQETKTPGERLALLAPGQPVAVPLESLTWLPKFLHWWRDTNRPSVAAAYEDFEAEWTREHGNNELMMAQLPSIDMVRYALDKMTPAEREYGRTTGAEYKSLLPFVRRDWSVMPVNGVWVGDGHGIKMEVIHPQTGWPFMAEITLIIEGVTRAVMGWSLALSESQVAVGDAIRHAISQHGVPLVYYSDNGGGEKNRTFDDETTGIFSRLGIDHPTGIPGNPQARGIIERLNKEIPARVAKRFGSYVGKSGDRETQRVYRRKVRSAFAALSKGKELTAEQKRYVSMVPTWDQLLEEIEIQVQRHNSRPHDSLPRRDGGRGPHWSPMAYRKHLIERDSIEIDYLTSAELHEMLRPEITRTAIRGEVVVFHNKYFSEALAKVEGEKVRVCFDIHNPNSVIVRRMDGSWVCDAIWDGNKVAAFPVPYMEVLQERRNENRRKRLLDKLEQVDAEGTPVLAHKPDTVIPVNWPGSIGSEYDDEDDGLVFTSAAARLRAMNEK